MKTLITALCLGAFALVGGVASAFNVPAEMPEGPLVLSAAEVHTVSGEVLRPGQVRIEDGRIVAVGEKLEMSGASLVDLGPLHLYPGLIAADTTIGLAEIESVRATVDSAEVGAFNPNVRAEVAFNPDSEQIPVTRANGILSVLSVPQPGRGGVISGTSALMSMDGWTWEDMQIMTPVGLHLFWPDVVLPDWLPAAIREQAEAAAATNLKLLDREFERARAHAALPATDPAATAAPDLRLSAMLPVLRGERTVFIHAQRLKAMRAAIEFADRFDLRIVLVGAQDAWRMASTLKERDLPVIIGGVQVLPLRRDEPEATAYANAARLHEAGVRFAIAGSGGGFASTTTRNLPYEAASAAAHGLPRIEALRAVSLYPAQILGAGARLGSIEAGKDATLFATNGDPLEVRTSVLRAWIRGAEIDLSSRHTRLHDKYRQKYPETRGAAQP